jgi:hypothetical protein
MPATPRVRMGWVIVLWLHALVSLVEVLGAPRSAAALRGAASILNSSVNLRLAASMRIPFQLTHVSAC